MRINMPSMLVDNCFMLPDTIINILKIPINIQRSYIFLLRFAWKSHGFRLLGFEVVEFLTLFGEGILEEVLLSLAGKKFALLELYV